MSHKGSPGGIRFCSCRACKRGRHGNYNKAITTYRKRAFKRRIKHSFDCVEKFSRGYTD